MKIEVIEWFNISNASVYLDTFLWSKLNSGIYDKIYRGIYEMKSYFNELILK